MSAWKEVGKLAGAFGGDCVRAAGPVALGDARVDRDPAVELVARRDRPGEDVLRGRAPDDRGRRQDRGDLLRSLAVVAVAAAGRDIELVGDVRGDAEEACIFLIGGTERELDEFGEGVGAQGELSREQGLGREVEGQEALQQR